VNRFAPPSTRIQDYGAEPCARAGWSRVLASVGGVSLVAIALAWGAVPYLASICATLLRGAPTPGPDAISLASDEFLSAVVFFLAAYAASRVCFGRHILAALGVGLAGWAFHFFVEVGGLQPLLSGAYPLWYEFIPTHFGPAALAALVASYHFQRDRKRMPA